MTDRIYLAQHGVALGKTENPERPLSPDGIQQTQTIARYIQQANLPVEYIFHSGKLRAKQTADIFAEAMNIAATSAIAGLSPNDDVALLAEHLTLQTLYVGHLPHLAKLASCLVTGNENTNIIQFQNSALLCLEKKPGDDSLCWQLCWYLPATFPAT